MTGAILPRVRLVCRRLNAIEWRGGLARFRERGRGMRVERARRQGDRKG